MSRAELDSAIRRLGYHTTDANTDASSDQQPSDERIVKCGGVKLFTGTDAAIVNWLWVTNQLEELGITS